jgi:sugar lactone lactonase YvrE
MPTTADATHLLSVGATLGEGPIWIDDALWFVDIKQRTIFRHAPTTGALDRWTAPEFVGWVVPAADGALIAGLKSGPHRFTPADGAFARLAEVDAEHPANRLNDAAVHPNGRVYFGTMDNDEADASGRLFVLDRGAVTPTALAPVVITNGPAITPDGRTLFHVDTLGRTVSAHPVATDGSVGEGRAFLRFTGDTTRRARLPTRCGSPSATSPRSRSADPTDAPPMPRPHARGCRRSGSCNSRWRATSSPSRSRSPPPRRPPRTAEVPP